MTHAPPGPRRDPAISVVVPAFNRETTLSATLDALQAQTFADWEAIVVDDGSADGTAALAESYAARDARIRVQRQANGGVSRARNAGIALARAPWLFFLDADDWVVAPAFALLLAAAAADPQADAVYGGYVRVDDAGRELARQLPRHEPDLFPLFARTCAISIHTCIVKRELVQRAGGFDETLVTCEDWDLWQRVARLGARFAAIPDYIAYYRMRVGSASGSGRRMLHDGLLVIDRGHGEDPRVESRVARQPLLHSARDVARTYFACYAAGLEIAAGRDASDMVDVLGDGISGDVDPHGVAETLFHAVPVGRACGPADWGTFPPQVQHGCERFVDALAARVGSHWLAFGARNVLARLQLGAAPGGRPRQAGTWYLAELELTGAPPPELELDGVERLLCDVRHAGCSLADLELAVVDGWMPARVLADAVAAALAWDVLQAHLEREVHPALTIAASYEGVRVERAGRELFVGPLDPTRTRAQGLHDAIGWALFLEELWGPAPPGGWYAADGAERAGPARRRTASVEPLELDLADPLPALELRGVHEATIALRVAGVPLSVVRCEGRGGRVSAHALRRAILLQTGFELCRAVVREAIVLAPAGASGTLGQRLALGRAEGEPPVPAGVTTIGRGEGPDGSAASRWQVVPADAAAERLALARRDGDPLRGPEDRVERLLSAPVVLAGSGARRQVPPDAVLRSLEFERIFGAGADPWDYGSPYEQEKYRQTLALLPPGVERALELGCAEGVFTRMLAERVRALVAADISQQALARARRRCAGRPHVTFTQLDLFEQPIAGSYDLIVCSELLYYADEPAQLDAAARRIADALEPGGHLLSAHAHAVVDEPDAPGFDWDVPFGAAAIEAALLRTRALELVREIRTDPYRVQLYRRRARRGLRPARVRAVRGVEAAAELVPLQAARFLAQGGRVRREPEQDGAATTTRLPILMYHRVAPEGRPETQRWRLHPRDFEAQLRHLREAGYQSVTFEQWRAAADRRIPLPRRSAMLTFDDGYADFPQHALPLLRRYGFQATMFVVTDLVGASNVWDEGLGESLALMDWPTLLGLREHGVELGSHSAQHRPLVALGAAELARDLCRSRTALHERTGVPVRSVCYPFGLNDVGVRAIAAACGFHYGVTTDEWPASYGDELLGLPRLEVRGTDPLEAFVAQLEG